MTQRLPRSLSAVRRAAASCERCSLYRNATQTVFGEGPARPTLMLIGEQPGDQEDRQGRPFVGPAGRVLDRALAEAGIDRGEVYVTNAVKHFKNVPRGKKRLHQKPNPDEVRACKWWLEQEVALLRPRLAVALGATAARALFGRTVTISRARGAPMPVGESPPGDPLEAFVTIHPSYVLRQRDKESRARQYALLVEDLRTIARHARTRLRSAR